MSNILYCEDCMLICENICEKCGNNNLTTPKVNDPVYLTTKNGIWAGALEDVLKTNEIPFLKRGTMGAALASKAGLNMEQYGFFVPYGAYEKSLELVNELFTDID